MMYFCNSCDDFGSDGKTINFFHSNLHYQKHSKTIAIKCY